MVCNEMCNITAQICMSSFEYLSILIVVKYILFCTKIHTPHIYAFVCKIWLPRYKNEVLYLPTLHHLSGVLIYE